MKHLFTLSERLKGWGRGSVTSAISATSASAIFCKLVGMVKLFMPFMKATKRESDTTIFAESLKSLKSLMSFFAESAESAESAKPIFANRGVKDVRVSLDQSPTNIQRISNLYITPNRYFTRFAAVFALVFCLGVGQVWGATYTYDFTKGAQTAYWTSDNNNTSVGTSNIGSFYYMQSGYSGHRFTAGNGSTSTHNHKFNTTNNQQCFFLGQTGEYLTLPTYAGEKITNVNITIRSNYGSSAVGLNIYSNNVAVSTASTSVSTSTGTNFAINSSYQSSQLKVQVTNAKNAAITKIIITTAVSCNSWSNPTVNYSATTLTVGGAHATVSSITGTTYGAVSYASSNTSILTVNSSTGEVTPVSNGTAKVTVSWAGDASHCAKDVDVNFTINNPPASITLNNYSGSATVTGYHVGDSFTLPSTNNYSCSGGKTFVGWSIVEFETTNTKPTSNFYEPGASVTLEESNIFYAVFATQSDFTRVTDISQLGAGNVIVVVDNSNTKVLTTTPGYANAPTENAQGKITPDASMIWTLEASSSNWKLKTGGSYLGTTSTSNGTQVSLTSTNNTWEIASSSGATNTFYLRNTAQAKCCLEYNSSNPPKWVVYNNNSYTSSTYFTERLYVATRSAYSTSCCTPLAQVEGSVNVSPSRNGATVSWSKVANASGYEYKLGDGAWTTATVSDMDNPSTTISGLEGATQYSINLRATGTGNYCSEGPEMTEAEEFTTLSRVTAAVNDGERGAAKVSTDNENWYASVDAADGTTIYLQANPNSGYTLYSWAKSTDAGSISNNQLSGSWTGDVTVTATFALAELPKLDTPTGMSSSVTATNSATVSWTAVANATGYTVTCEKTSDQSTTGIVIGSVTGDATRSCTISGLTAGTGYTWTVLAKGNGTSNKNSDACAAQTFTTLHEYTLTYKEANGDENGSGKVVENATSFTNTTAPSKTGYNLEGFYTTSALDVKVASDERVLVANISNWTGDGGAYTKAANADLYLNWTAKTMDVTLDNQSATTAGTDKVTGTYDQGLPSIATNLPEKTGYTFQGYYSETEGNGTKYINADGTANGTWDKEVATTLYAYWTINSYTVTWKVAGNDYNAGVTDANDHANYNTTVNVPTAPAASLLGEQGCADTFMGWSKKNGGHDAKAASYYDDLFTTTSPAITENTIFYAVFAKENGGTATATFDPSTQAGLTNSDRTWTHTASGITLQLVGNASYTKRTETHWQIGYTNGQQTAHYATITSPKTISKIQITLTDEDYKVNSVTNGSLSTSGTSQTITGSFTTTTLYPYVASSNSQQARMSNIVVTYSTTSYSDYVTECAPLTCSVPQSLSSEPGKNGATISWSAPEVGTASKYQYAVWAEGEEEPTSGYSETTNTNATIEGLISNTEYNWKVRTVCTGTDGESEFVKSTFTTGSVDLTFSVPTGVSSVTASTSASPLPSAGVPDACAGCWSFAGWSSDENATSVEYAADGTYKFDDDKTLYAVYGKGNNTYKLIDDVADLTANEYYIITAVSSETEYALTNEGHASYAEDAKSLDITAKVEEVGDDYFISYPEAKYVWKFTGNASAGKLYNVEANKYIQLSNYSSSSILDASGENLTFTVGNDGEWTIKNGSAYLRCYGSGFDASSSSSSVYIYKRQMGSLTTAPDCSGHTVEWYVAGKKVRTDEDITSCDGVVSLPSVDVADVRCKTEGTTFMGWSETNVGVTPTSDADEIAALNLFTDAADAPAITADKQFYAVFAEEISPESENPLLSEEFDNSQTGDATQDFDGTKFSNFNGTAYKAYTSKYGGVKLGASGAPGYITSKSLDLSKTFYVRLDAQKYDTDGGDIEITVGSVTQKITSSELSKDESRTFTKKFDAATSTSTIKIGTSTKRAYIDNVVVYTITPAAYSNYFTECCPQKAVTLSGVDETVGKHFESDKEEACEGEIVTLSKTEDGYYTFGGWAVYKTGDKNTTVTVINNQFEMPDYAVTVEAEWNPKNYKATVASEDNNKGTVSVIGGSIDGDDFQVAYGSPLTLTAVPVDEDHYYFQNWTVTPDIPELDLTQNPLVITMPGNNIAVTANFGAVAYPALTLETSEAYTLTATLANGDPIEDMGAIRSGTALKVSYVLNGQNEKTGWTLTPATTYGESENYITFNMPSEALHVALAVRPYYTLGLSAENGSISSVEIDDEPQTPTTTSYNVHAGEIVEVVATPTNDTYKFIGWEKTGDAATYSGASTTATLKVGTENMTLKAVFEAKATYNLTLNALGRTQEVIPALEGTDVASLLEGKEAVTLKGFDFVGWSETEDGEAISGDALKLNGDKTVYAVYSAEAYYQKVTSTDDITDGQYLIVYEDGSLAFDGGLETLDAVGNTISVTIANNKIAITDDTKDALEAAEFTIDATAGTIKSASGFYIGQTSDANGLASNAGTAYTNTLGFDEDGNANIVSSSAHLRYNSASNQNRFRYYKSSSYTGQKAIQLYKKVAPGANESNPTTVVANNEVLVIDADATLNNLTIEAGGKVETTNELTVINNLTIESEAGKSGQIDGTSVAVNGDIYLEIKLDKSGTMDPHKYYCISAPFDVAALEWGNGTPMVFNVDYQLFIYDGGKRARTGNGWQRVGGTMEKNSAYFIGFDDGNANNQNIIRLKAAGKAIPTATSIELEAHSATYGQNESEIAKNSNWNGLGNPRLNYVNLNKNVSVYEAEEERFDTYAEELANGFVVGTAFFVQGTGDLTFENEVHGAYRAPKRESEHYMYCVEIAQENASRYDNRLYVMASETASTSFEEGKDLPTLNSETSKYGALIWTKNYGMRLVIEETPMVNNKASYELGIFAPANGTYRIETPTESENADLYLTKDGRVIWNLSMNGYEAELTKGQNEGYGLLLVRKAPSVATGVDEPTSDSSLKGRATKVVIDEHVYILRGGQMYDVTGKAVK